MPKLTLKFEHSVLKEVPIGSSEVSIGRSPDNGLVIDNPSVSNYHARVFNEEEIHFVMSFAYVLATSFDRFQAEQKLRESRRRFEDLVESIEGIVWEADAQTFQATFVSRQAERLLGFPVALWISEPHFWLHRP